MLLRTLQLHSRMLIPLWRQLHQLLPPSKRQQGSLRGRRTSRLVQAQQAPSTIFSAHTLSLQQPPSTMNPLHPPLHLMHRLDLQHQSGQGQQNPLILLVIAPQQLLWGFRSIALHRLTMPASLKIAASRRLAALRQVLCFHVRDTFVCKNRQILQHEKLS